MIITGVDIGYKGGITKFNVQSKDNYKLVSYIPMPIIKTKVNKKIKKRINIDLFINEIKSSDIVIAEDIHAMPCQGSVSTFNFGVQRGLLEGICGALGIKLVFILPQKWKKYFNLIHLSKSSSVDLVNSFFDLSLAKTKDGIADSILIGLFYIQVYI